jgi:orotate phosphoribosyltransferase
MERSGKDGALSESSAVQEVTKAYGMPVVSIGNLNDLLEYISAAGEGGELARYREAVAAYRERYGVL